MIGLLEKIVCMLFPERDATPEEQDMDRLEARFLQHPALAIEQSRLVTCSMAQKAQMNLMDYWGLNIPQETMLTLTEEVTGKRELPGFTVNVLLDEEVNCYLRPLHEMIMAGAGDLDKEENLLLLISLLLRRYGQPFSRKDDSP